MGTKEFARENFNLKDRERSDQLQKFKHEKLQRSNWIKTQLKRERNLPCNSDLIVSLFFRFWKLYKKKARN